MIPNPTPVTATFSGMWITTLSMLFPSEVRHGAVTAVMMPWEGGSHLLATGRRILTRKMAQLITDDAEFAAIVDDIKTTIARLSNNSAPIRSLTVSAGDPAKPIRIIATFATETPTPAYIVQDADALALQDNDFAALFTSAMGKIAALTLG